VADEHIGCANVIADANNGLSVIRSPAVNKSPVVACVTKKPLPESGNMANAAHVTDAKNEHERIRLGLARKTDVRIPTTINGCLTEAAAS
jgi:hypothetical protein